MLDLGCGNGRIAHLLPESVTYTGMDFSSGMLDEARKSVAGHDIAAQFVLGNLMDDDWPAAVVHTKYDWIFLRAVLHHIPAYTQRVRLLNHASELLVEGGVLVMANWQFLNIPRLKKRIISWEQLNLDPEEVETGDYLLGLAAGWLRDALCPSGG